MGSPLDRRLARMEERTVVPLQPWFRIVAPDVMDDATFAAWQAAELAKLPPNARVIVRRIVAP